MRTRVYSHEPYSRSWRRVFVALRPLLALGLLSSVAPPTLTGGDAPAGVSAAFRWLVGFSQVGPCALIADAVRDWLRERDRYWSAIAVAERSCLGMCCEDGVAVVVQPHDEWFAEATADDVPTLMTKTFGAAADGTGRGEPATTD